MPGLVVHRTTQAGAVRLAGSGGYRAVICGLGGRLALPGSYLAARSRRIPFVLWATIWAHPRTPAHFLSALPTKALYRRADAVATYGEHVSRHVEESRGDRGGIVVAPQAVDVEHFGAEVPDSQREHWRELAGAGPDDVLVAFTGRLEREKGIATLIAAWPRLHKPAKLIVAGTGPLADDLAKAIPGARLVGHVTEFDLPAFYAAADVLVLPSIRTASFTEPWGLVTNEAMLQGTPTIASDAVGAVAGGLVRDGRTGLVFPSGDARALAARIDALTGDPGLRTGMGQAARSAAVLLSPEAWATGMGEALDLAGAGKRRGDC